jgi:hypothetical protein
MTEPTTTLTDYAIAVFGFIFAAFLLRVGWRRQRSVCLWAVAFGFVAIAAGLGGTCHGFVRQLGTPLASCLWDLMIYALSLASFALLTGTIFGTVPQRQQNWMLAATFTKSLLTWTSLLYQPSFTIAACDYGAAIAAALILHLRSLTQATAPILLAQPAKLQRPHLQQPKLRRADLWMIIGILISGLAIGVLSSQFTFALHFNQNDLYHLVQLVGLGALYQGAKQLQDR